MNPLIIDPQRNQHADQNVFFCKLSYLILGNSGDIELQQFCFIHNYSWWLKNCCII